MIPSDLYSIFFGTLLSVPFDSSFVGKKTVVDAFIRIAARGGMSSDELSRALWAMLYADDAGIASRTQLSLADHLDHHRGVGNVWSRRERKEDESHAHALPK